MDKIEQRKKQIKDLLSTTEFLTADSLAATLGVTGATIRKDLREMEANYEVYRSRGLVSLVRPKIIDKSINEKIFIRAEEKKSIGAAAAAMIGKNDAILITSGSTIDSMARQIEADGSLSVVTTSIGVALALSQKPDIDVMILGGRLIRNSLSVRDDYSIQGLRNISCTKLFFSCDGLDLGTGVITAFVEEARMTAAMMKASTRKILLADSSKIGKTGLGKICDISDVDVLITDPEIPWSVRQEFEKMGVSVVIAGEEGYRE
ncbi:MAG: DeoR/GlpR transcriptional regulator [Bacteroidales bacterium]|nr:DeoR/GlpR transcriptional regulator [Bacteroidales bacterium]